MVIFPELNDRFKTVQSKTLTSNLYINWKVDSKIIWKCKGNRIVKKKKKKNLDKEELKDSYYMTSRFNISLC